MKPSRKLNHLSLRSTCNNQRGIVLPLVLMFLAVLAAMGSVTTVMTRAEIKTGDNYRNNEEAFFLAQAGAEHAREQLRATNAVSAMTGLFTDELGTAAGANGLLDGDVSGTDDVPLVNTATYSVYLTNDPTDGVFNLTDT
ncbi:MAG: hypothetical protein GTO40_15640, partial [Deltaproteobacteria bacterium]|nr:hypothetical protein [Deltaproteobacteria bacterium]